MATEQASGSHPAVEKSKLLAALRAKGTALKTMLASVPALKEGTPEKKWPSMLLAESLNQLSAETAKVLPEFAGIMPSQVVPLPDNHDYSSEDFFTLLTLTETIVAVLNEVAPCQKEKTGGP